MDERTLQYGTAKPIPERIPLCAGPLRAIYENGDLRSIKLGEREVVRRIYFAARDRAWGTAPNVLRDVQMAVREDSFEISYTCENKLNDVNFVWQGRLKGSPNGTIECSFTGIAKASFLRNRLGFCILHPIGLVGVKARIEKMDGTSVLASFPKSIVPQLVVEGILKPAAPFDEMRALSHQVEPNVWLRVAFEGDIFETEDQRNWSDGSFKTYGTPLRLPFPAKVQKGTRIAQKITLSIRDSSGKPQELKPSKAKQATTFRLLKATFEIPRVGLSVAASGKHLVLKEAKRLNALKLAHLRVDLPLWDKGWKTKLKNAAKDAVALNIALEIALFVSDAAEAELSAFVAEMRRWSHVSVARHLLFHTHEAVTTLRWLALAQKLLGAKAILYGGTNQFFTEINRNRPNTETLKTVSGLCYSFNPQVHAFDNATLMESPEGQADTVRTHKTFAKKKPLAITGITLKPRFSLANVGPEPADQVHEFDVRQRSLFGAAWTLATLKQIIEADGVSSITLYETAGSRGVIEGALAFPMYHVFADIAEFSGKLVASKTTDALKVTGLALRNGRKTRVLLANLTAESQAVTIKGLGRNARIKMLDASNAEWAMRQAESYRQSASSPLESATIGLPPYAIAKLDW